MLLDTTYGGQNGSINNVTDMNQTDWVSQHSRTTPGEEYWK